MAAPALSLLGCRHVLTNAGDHSVEADLDQVDPGERDHDVARDHDTAPQKPVEQVDQGDLRECLTFAASRGRVAHVQSSVAKE